MKYFNISWRSFVHTNTVVCSCDFLRDVLFLTPFNPTFLLFINLFFFFTAESVPVTILVNNILIYEGPVFILVAPSGKCQFLLRISMKVLKISFKMN